MSPATMETSKCKKEDQNDPAIKLKNQWKDRGIVTMNSYFMGMSQNMYIKWQNTSKHSH